MLGAAEVESFLTDLATRHNVSASTQNQAQSAILFLYRQVLGIELPWLDGVVRPKRPVLRPRQAHLRTAAGRAGPPSRAAALLLLPAARVHLQLQRPTRLRQLAAMGADR